MMLLWLLMKLERFSIKFLLLRFWNDFTIVEIVIEMVIVEIIDIVEIAIEIVVVEIIDIVMIVDENDDGSLLLLESRDRDETSIFDLVSRGLYGDGGARFWWWWELTSFLYSRFFFPPFPRFERSNLIFENDFLLFFLIFSRKAESKNKNKSDEMRRILSFNTNLMQNEMIITMHGIN